MAGPIGARKSVAARADESLAHVATPCANLGASVEIAPRHVIMNKPVALHLFSAAAWLGTCAALTFVAPSSFADEPGSAKAVAPEQAKADTTPAAVAVPAEPSSETAAESEIPVVDIAPTVDRGVTCEPQRRSGSRIARMVCSTASEREAREQQEMANAKQYARDLDRERAMRDQQARQGSQSNGFIVFQ